MIGRCYESNDRGQYRPALMAVRICVKIRFTYPGIRIVLMMATLHDVDSALLSGVNAIIAPPLFGEERRRAEIAALSYCCLVCWCMSLELKTILMSAYKSPAQGNNRYRG